MVEKNEDIIKKIDKNALREISKEISKEAIKEIIKEQKDKRLHNTQLLLKNYNTLKKHINNINDDMKIELEFLEEQNCKLNDVWIIGIARSKIRTAKMLGYLESALKVLKDECRKNGEEYKFKAFSLFYIERMKYEDIVKELNCSINSPRNWAKTIIERLNILLWGIDAIGI